MKKPEARDPTVYNRVPVILTSAQTHAARSVNTAQVVPNWLIGREIVFPADVVDPAESGMAA